MGRSDLVRRAMAKKKHDVMAQEKEIFIHGLVEDGERDRRPAACAAACPRKSPSRSSTR